MNVELLPGDLLTGRPITGIFTALLARPAGATYWTVRLSRQSIMTVAEAPVLVPSAEGEGIVTVLHEGQLLDLFLSDVKRLDGTE